MSGSIDAAVSSVSSDGKYYFFIGDQYVRYTQGVGVDAGYPKAIGWRGLADAFPPPYDAVLRHRSEEKYYFFAGDEYMRYTSGDGPDWTSPKKIVDEWNDLWERFPGPYDSAVLGRKNEKSYFFKGDQYVRYEHGVGIDGDAYPRAVNWNGMGAEFPPPYSAACSSAAKDGIYYFFSGSDYVRYLRGTGIDRTPSTFEYPLPWSYAWPGLWALEDCLPPVLGAYTPTGPYVWVWQRNDDAISLADPTTVSLELVATQSNANLPGVVKLLRILGMDAGATVDVVLETDGYRVGALSIHCAPDKSAAAALVVAHGSCIDDARNLRNSIPTLVGVAQSAARLAILNGDTSYYVGGNSTGETAVCDADLASQWRMFMRLFRTRCHPDVQAVLGSIPTVGTWDDHDFAWNNSDGTKIPAELLKETTEAFRIAWPNDYLAPGGSDPIGTSLRYGQVEFFVPDSRTWRDGSTQILGPTQCADLVAQMAASDAALKVLVSSSQFLPKRGGESYWNTARAEREELLAGLQNVSGRVLSLTGDVHYSELTFGGDPTTPDLVEVTASPFLLKASGKDKDPSADPDESRIWSVKGNAFTLLDITFVDGQPRIEIQCVGPSGLGEIYNKGPAGAAWTKPVAVWDETGTLSQS